MIFLGQAFLNQVYLIKHICHGYFMLIEVCYVCMIKDTDQFLSRFLFIYLAKLTDITFFFIVMNFFFNNKTLVVPFTLLSIYMVLKLYSIHVYLI